MNGKNYYVGIDLGGTFIKGGIVDREGNLLVNDKTPTESTKGAEAVAKNIATLCFNLLREADLTPEQVVGIGMGVPGLIDSERGEVVYSNNLHWEHFLIGDKVQELTSLPVKIANDANVAALGEAKFGIGKEFQSSILITLGTGVGSGIVINGKLFEGNRSAGAEIGHMVIVADGEPCTCGRRGCFEAYASANALIRMTQKAMGTHPASRLWEVGLEGITGATAFEYRDRDECANEVVEEYLDKLGCGLTNIANVFRPEAIILGGGVSAEGEPLAKALQARVDWEIYAGIKGPKVKILIASLGNSAGLLGAAALWMD